MFRRRTTDPKFAIHLGCADARLVSQFSTPEKSDKDGDDADTLGSGCVAVLRLQGDLRDWVFRHGGNH
jgi:hypothetical protein